MITELPYATQRVVDMLAIMDSVVDETLVMLADKEIDLDTRWDLYLKIEKALPMHVFMGKAIRELTDSPYEEIFFDRHEVRYNSAIDQQLHDNYDPDADDLDDDEYFKNGRALWAKRDAWREAVLAEGYGAVTFDW